jgi:hypothetical protein
MTVRFNAQSVVEDVRPIWIFDSTAGGPTLQSATATKVVIPQRRRSLPGLRILGWPRRALWNRQ